MSLYEGVDADINADKKGATGWSAGLKLLQSQIQLRKAGLTKVKRDRARISLGSAHLTSSSSIAPVVDLAARNREKESNKSFTSDGEQLGSTLQSLPFFAAQLNTRKAPEAVGGHLIFGDVKLQQEYNPMLPNDYEKIKQERDRNKVNDERGRKEQHGPPDRKQMRTGNAGIAIAPPQSLLECDTSLIESTVSSSFPVDTPNNTGKNVAARIMEKYGYKHGQGLGKQEQGMSTALKVEKVSRHGGKIIHEKDNKESEGPSITEILRNPTKVVLLKNMVGPGEVDDELEGETREECSKYGVVSKCTIFEVPDASEDEAVRIFLEYMKVDSAIKAVVDLNGRFFGGRQISASFYNLDKFRRMELAD